MFKVDDQNIGKHTAEFIAYLKTPYFESIAARFPSQNDGRVVAYFRSVLTLNITRVTLRFIKLNEPSDIRSRRIARSEIDLVSIRHKRNINCYF
jgi:hypothetical protein